MCIGAKGEIGITKMKYRNPYYIFDARKYNMEFLISFSDPKMKFNRLTFNLSGLNPLGYFPV